MSQRAACIGGILVLCGIAASSHAQVQQTNPSGLPVWTNIVDLSVPYKGGYVARGTCPCSGTTTPENESDCGIPTDTINGGCNSTPNVFGTISLGETVCGTAQIGTNNLRDTDWYRFTITETTNVEFAVTAEYPVQVLLIQDGCPAVVRATGLGPACTEVVAHLPSLAPGSYIAFTSPQQGSAFFTCDSGSTAYMGTLRTYEPPPPPANDNCADATDASAGGDFPFDTTSASNDAAGSCGASAASPDVWFKVTPTMDGNVSVSTCNSVNYDTVLSAYDGCGGNQIVCLDDFCGLQTQITFPVTVGPTYYIRVSGYNNASGSGTVNISPPAPPLPGTWIEEGDAGDLPDSAQVPMGSGALNAIQGIMDVGSADMYSIQICDSSSFSASLAGGATFDTQLFLFDSSGLGVTFNDDSVGLQSAITNQFVTANGDYYIAVSAYDNDPNGANGAIWIDTPFNVERQPDGPGAADPVSSWSGGGGSGPYTLTLTGTCFPGGGTGCHGRCVADFDDGTFTGTPDGGVTIDDLLYYLAIFGDGAICADVDNGTFTGTQDGGVTIDDLLYYLTRFADGC